MIKKIKKRIKEFIVREIDSKMSGLSENFGHHSWDNQIAINFQPKNFKPLLNVSNYIDGITYIDPKSLELETDITQYIRNDSFPLPSTEDREGYMDERHYEYWLFGLSDYLIIKKTLKRHGVNIKQGFRIYDLGCASGRVTRHFLSQEKKLELWASDINKNHVEWVTKYLEERINVFQNHSLPHLPCEDNYFDLIYAFSVFTHIDAFETAWLLELRRILKPGGFAYLTTHSDHTWSIMKKGMPIFEALLKHPDFTSNDVKNDMPSNKMVYRWQSRESYRANVFYDTEYIRNIWGRYFEIVEIIQEGCFYQDVVLLRKK